MEAPRGLQKAPGGGVWWPGGDLGLDLPLPADVRANLKNRDTLVHIALIAPGCDRPIAPSLQLEFGRSPRPSLSWSLSGEVLSGGVRCLLPRGVTRVRLLPDTRPFWAGDLDVRIDRIIRRSPRGQLRLFSSVRGQNGGIGDLASAFVETDGILTGAYDLALEANGAFETRSSDPRLLFRLRRPMKPGWYRIDAVMLAAEPPASRLYLEHEGGFLEHEGVDLAPRGYGRSSGYFWIDREISVLRFDLADQAGVIGALLDLTVRPAAAPVAQVLRPSILRAIRSQRLARQTLSRLVNPKGEDGAWALPVLARGERQESGDGPVEYALWREAYDYDAKSDAETYRRRLEGLKSTPLISILMPAWRTPLELLDAAIESVIAQHYESWELVIADDASGDEALVARLDDWAKRDSRIRPIFCKKNGGISRATNAAFKKAKGEWIALLDHDDELSPHALAEVALAIEANPNAELIYSDEDKMDPTGRRYDPYFKPDFSYHLLLGQNYFNHLTVHKAENITAVGGWRPKFDGSQDYDLNLRIVAHVDRCDIVHIPKILYHWRSVPGSTAASGDEKSYAYDAGLQALVGHLSDIDETAAVRRAEGTPWYRVDFPIPDPAPKVSLIIPTRDRAELLRLSVGTILEKTEYQNYEILIVDNQSSEPETFEAFREFTRDPRVKVLHYDQPFNFSAINNHAAERAQGEILGLINNDVEVIDPFWLREMVSHAVRPDIGCVGAKLFYPDDTIQHGGVVIGVGGVAGHSHKYFPRDTTGYFGRMALTHEVSAVTAACLLVRKAVYDQVGGLTEAQLAVAFNDVDFCLKVLEAGYLNLFTPHAALYHHESVSRGAEDSPEKKRRFQREVEYMLQRWSTDLRHDPYYSPSLSITHEDFRLRDPEEARREGVRSRA